MVPRPARRPRLAIGLLVVGSLLLLSTLWMGWYSASIANGIDNVDETLYVTHVQLAGDQSGYVFNQPTSYSSVALPGTGVFYIAIAALVVGAAVLGLLTCVLIIWRRGDGRAKRTKILLAVAVILAASAVIVPLGVQPFVYCSDSSNIPGPIGPSGYGNSSAAGGCRWAMFIAAGGSPGPVYASPAAGPQHSFFGHELWVATSAQTGYSFSWGPWIGWYVALIAALFIAAGAQRYRSWLRVTRSRGPDAGNDEAGSAVKSRSGSP